MGESKPGIGRVVERIVLAHEAPFDLGPLRIEPATRQLRCGARAITLEPRVMQVLVVLARADGGIVTRDELIARCWDGRIVGDDAINRVISRIRTLAGNFGAGEWTVETITKVGYRLLLSGGLRDDADAPATSEIPAPAAIADAWPRRALLQGTAAAIGAVALAGGYVFYKRQSEPSTTAQMLVERGWNALDDGRPGNATQAVAYLTEATRQEPRYAEAWGALAVAHSGSSAARSQSAARIALEIDPDEPHARFAELMRQPFIGNWLAIEPRLENFPRTKRLESRVSRMLALLYADVGRWSDAAAELGPRTPSNYQRPLDNYLLILSLWGAGRLDEAEAVIARSSALWPTHSAIFETAMKFFTFTGRAHRALAIIDDVHAREPYLLTNSSDETAATARAMLHRNAGEIAHAVKANLDWYAKNKAGNATTAAVRLSGLGRPDLGLPLVEQHYGGLAATNARASSSDLLTHPLFQPPMAPLWKQPRFTALLETIGLEAYWRQSGHQPDFRSA